MERAPASLAFGKMEIVLTVQFVLDNVRLVRISVIVLLAELILIDIHLLVADVIQDFIQIISMKNVNNAEFPANLVLIIRFALYVVAIELDLLK
jgi:hypothetical protein